MARPLRRFTDEQIERANRVDIVGYAKSQGLTLTRVGKSYKVKNYSGGFFITPEENSWNWFNEERGGGVVQLCMELENKSWLEAVRTLLNEDMEPIRHTREWKPEPEPPREFHLPDANSTYKHMIAYLTKTRGIEPSVLKAMIDRKYIYENVQKSCVFVGRDKEGNAHHASIRSTNTVGKVFKQDVPGSQKAYSFNIPGDSGTLNVFEAPIDLLSYVSLQKLLGKQTRDSYLSLGGVTDKALERFLQDYDVEKIRVCTDADEAGEKAVARIYEKYHERYKVTRHRPEHKDFNEDLMVIRQQQMQQKQEQAVENNTQDMQQVKDETEVQETKQISEPVSEDYFIRGKCEVLIICDNQQEVDAYREIQIRVGKNSFGMDYEPNEYYLAYRDIEQVRTVLQENSQITKIVMRTSRTPAGIDIADDVARHFDNVECDIARLPKLNRYSEDLAQMKAIETVIEQTPIEDMQVEVAVGMEM